MKLEFEFEEHTWFITSVFHLRRFLSNPLDNAYDLIDAFTWSQTPQGGNYWHERHMNPEKITLGDIALLKRLLKAYESHTTKTISPEEEEEKEEPFWLVYNKTHGNSIGLYTTRIAAMVVLKRTQEKHPLNEYVLMKSVLKLQTETTLKEIYYHGA